MICDFSEARFEHFAKTVTDNLKIVNFFPNKFRDFFRKCTRYPKNQ